MTFPSYSQGRVWLGGVAILACTLFAYLPALQAGYVWDDDQYVTRNETLESVEGLGRIWTELGAVPQYYPIVHTSYWIEYRLWGLEPAGYHAVNIVLHALNAIVLWFVLWKLGLRFAWLAGLVFALHPVHVESVAWITERKNVLSAFFYLIALLLYLRFDPPERTEIRRWALYGLSLASFALALLSKTVTCSLPAVILLLLWWKRGRVTPRDALPLVPWFVLGAALAWVTVTVERVHVGAQGPEWGLSFVERCLIAGRALWFYLGKLVWPVDLTFIYPRWAIDTSVAWQYVFPGAALAVVATLWILRRYLGRGPLVVALIFAGTLLPALGFFDVYPMRYSFVADHFQYLASAAVIALGCGLATRVLATRNATRTARTVLIVTVAAVLGTLTWQQALAYESVETLWRDTIAKNPAAWMAHHNLALALIGRDDAAAMKHVDQALEVKPDHASAHVTRGLLLLRQARVGPAKEAFNRAVELDADNYAALANMAKLHAREGDLQRAAVSFRRALEAARRSGNLEAAEQIRQASGLDE